MRVLVGEVCAGLNGIDSFQGRYGRGEVIIRGDEEQDAERRRRHEGGKGGYRIG